LNFIPVRGFVLGSRPSREADRIVQLYTLSLGRVKAVAKGARSPKSRTASALELFTEGDYSLHKSRSGDLFVLGQAKVLSAQGALKRDLRGITALQVLADVLVQTLEEAEPHPELYRLLKDLLGALERAPSCGETLLVAFGGKLLSLLGHPLELDACVSCGGSLKGRPSLLVPHRGGALCPECCPSAPAGLRVTAAGRETLRKLRDLPMDRAPIVKMGPAPSRALFLTVMDYIGRTVEKELRSVKYYLEINSKIGN
jgi:DNA repair protein RecO (recombination protein O)